MANDSSVINPVIIVGAGLSGLALTYRLERLGISPIIVDGAANVGAIWRHRYEQLRLNTHRRFSQLPGLAPPRNGGAYLSRDTLIRYLEDYERLLAASVEYGVHVKRIDREGDVWRVHTAHGVRKARHVVIATGRERIPNLPVWPGLGKYEGNLLHAAEFGNVEAYRDLAILVVGGGNSGVDLLNHLVTIPTRGLWLAVRNGVNVIPASLWGAPVHRLSGVMSWFPNRVVDRLMALTGLLAFGRLERYGLPRCIRGAATRLAEEGVAPAIDNGFVRALKCGRVQVVPAVERFRAKEVVLADRRRLRPDVVICATGYRTGLEPIIEARGVLDDQGAPRFQGGDSDGRLPGLWFLGMRPRLTGNFHAGSCDSRRLARCIARELAGDR